MIYPSRTAVLAAAAGAPVALLVAVLVPGRWYAGLAWAGAVVALTLFDAIGGAARGEAQVAPLGPAPVGGTIEARIGVRLAGGRTPATAEAAVATNALLGADDDGRVRVPLAAGRGTGLLSMIAHRRGTARLERLWLRWRGPLGLAWHQCEFPLDVSFPVLPDIRPVRERATFDRHAVGGLVAQVDRGDGTDFDALVEYRTGMDRRAIDWKQSARHLKLHAKEYRTERGEQIMFALDAGRQMAEPVAGLPRIDRAVSAMLLCAWTALKLGDRVALTAFDDRPRVAGGLVSGTAAFADLQRLAARIDYGTAETNYVLALTTLAARLTRRSLVVLLTEFTDLTAADFLVRAAGRLAQRHLLLVVVLRDEELEAIAAAAPASADDVTRAVAAAALLRDRRLVLTRLQHLGIHVVEAEHDRVGERLVAGYVDLKRRNLL